MKKIHFTFIISCFISLPILTGCTTINHKVFNDFSSAVKQGSDGVTKSLSINLDWERENIIQNIIRHNTSLSSLELIRNKKYEVTFPDKKPILYTLKETGNILNQVNDSAIKYAELLSYISESEAVNQLELEARIKDTHTSINNVIELINVKIPEEVVPAFSISYQEFASLVLKIRKKSLLKKLIKQSEPTMNSYSEKCLILIDALEKSIYHAYSKRFFQLEDYYPNISIKDKKREAKQRTTIENVLTLNDEYLTMLESLKKIKTIYMSLPTAHNTLYKSLTQRKFSLEKITEISRAGKRLNDLYIELKSGDNVISDSDIEPLRVYIQQVISYPSESEAVIIKNNSGITKDISGWSLGDKSNPVSYTIPTGTTLSDGQSKTFKSTTIGFQINDKDEIIYLKDNSGTLIDIWQN